VQTVDIRKVEQLGGKCAHVGFDSAADVKDPGRQQPATAD